MKCSCRRFGMDWKEGEKPEELYAFKRYPAQGTAMMTLFDQSYGAATYGMDDTNMLMPCRLPTQWHPFLVNSVLVVAKPHAKNPAITQKEMQSIAGSAAISLHAQGQCSSIPLGERISLDGEFMALLEWKEPIPATEAFTIGLVLGRTP